MLREHLDKLDIHFLRRNIQVEENLQDQLEVERNQLILRLNRIAKVLLGSLIPLRKQEKLARKGIKSRVRDIIRPGDKKYGYFNKGKPQSSSMVLLWLQHNIVKQLEELLNVVRKEV